jgi:hypothetical protein
LDKEVAEKEAAEAVKKASAALAEEKQEALDIVWEEAWKADKLAKAAIRSKLAEETEESSLAKARDLSTKRGQEIIDALYDASWGKNGKTELRQILRSRRKPPVEEVNYFPKVAGAITTEEESAIKDYTTRAYKNINNALRYGIEEIPPSKKEKVVKDIELIHSGLAKLPPYDPKDAFLVRFVPLSKIRPEGTQAVGDFLDKAYPLGETIIERTFLSVSHDVLGTGIWTDLSANKMGVKFIIRAKEKSVARNITHLNTSGESEVLYPPGMKFKVVDKYLHEFDAAIHKIPSFIMKSELNGKPRLNKLWVVELEEV